MQAGLQTYTNDGSIQFSSERGGRSLIAGAPFYASGRRMVNASPEMSYWAKLNRNSTAYIEEVGAPAGIHLSVVGSGLFRAAKNTQLNMKSGYCDVFDDTGVLNWSAASMPMIMNIQGVMRFTKYDLYYGGGRIQLGDDIWVNMAGTYLCEIVTDNVYILGIQLKRDSNGAYYLQSVWVGITGTDFLNLLPDYIYVPYATIPG